jgi:methionyl-tRNA formyltransferase
MTKPRVIFFGSKNSKFSDGLFYALEETDAEIAAVVHSPEGSMGSTSGKLSQTGYSDRAETLGIPAYEPADPNSPGFVGVLSGIPCDVFILGGYVFLIKEGLLALPKMGMAFNFHASLLPEYRGKHPVFWAVKNGETKSGVTAHHLSLKLDEGCIAFQEAVDIGPADSVPDVYDKIIEKSRIMMHELIDAISAGNVPSIPQTGKGSYFSSIPEEG